MRIFILLFFLVQLLPSNAQEIDYKLYLRHTIRQDDQTYQFATIETSKMAEMTYDLSKLYYWYKAQLVITTQGSASGVLLHGAFESFYDNKQLSSKGNFSKGLKHGTWMYWNEKGKLIRV